MWTTPHVVVVLALFAVPLAYATYKASTDTAPRVRAAAARGRGAKLPDARHE
jgi:ABC-type uncharacterized transport system substrate-binding protein